MPEKKRSRSKRSKTKISRARTIWTIAFNSLLICLMIIAFGIVFSMLPIKGNYKILSVMSGSMEPAIPLGGLVVIKPTQQYRVGDIITFRPLGAQNKNETVTHRINSIKTRGATKYYITKGDANDSPDSVLVTGDRIVGRKIATIALLGYLMGYIKTLPGLVFIIIIPATIIIYEEMKKIKNEIAVVVKNRSKLRLRKLQLRSKKKINIPKLKRTRFRKGEEGGVDANAEA